MGATILRKRLVSGRELSARLNVPYHTVLHWSRRGNIPRIRIGPKLIRFDLDAVIESLGLDDKD